MIDLNDPEIKTYLEVNLRTVLNAVECMRRGRGAVTYGERTACLWLETLLSSLKSKPAPIAQYELPFERTPPVDRE